jgi:hypothetical protein
MDYIDREGGRFVTVLPRNRLEDAQFRKAIQTSVPQWEVVLDRPNPRCQDGPRDRWSVHRAALPSMEGWSIVWLWSTLLTLHQYERRVRHIAAAVEELEQLRLRLASPKARLRGAAEIDLQVKLVLEKFHVARYLDVHRVVVETPVFKQTRRGRPGPDTAYRKLIKRRYDLHWSTNQKAIDYDRKSDGMYPLLTNDRTLSAAQIFEAHKGQPMIEKRFEQIKTVHEIAPVLLKDEGRIEALFTLYAIGLLVQALIERDMRRAMARENIAELPIYPEQRLCAHPTTEQLLRLFSMAQCHELLHEGRAIKRFTTDLTELQREVLRLLGVPITDYLPTT